MLNHQLPLKDVKLNLNNVRAVTKDSQSTRAFNLEEKGGLTTLTAVLYSS